MMLKELIKMLSEYPTDKVVKNGFGQPDSYRGYYEQLAFEKKDYTTVGQMLDWCRGAVGTIYEGYKGGEFLMDQFTSVWLANYGELGVEITEFYISSIMMNVFTNEKLAEYTHRVWSHWMKHMLKNKTEDLWSDDGYTCGDLKLLEDDIERWESQIKRGFENLSEEEKNSDREVVKTILKEMENDE